jgi:hypothetical protein
MQTTRNFNQMGSDDESDKFDPLKANKKRDDGDQANQANKGGKDKDDKQSNTIIQQINGFSMTPMTDRMAEQTIEDHKYLLELVENRAAIAFFAVANRNQSLFGALKNYQREEIKAQEEMNRQQSGSSKNKRLTAEDKEKRRMEEICNRIILEYDFMTLVMYPEIKARKNFVHDSWVIAKKSENTELKIAIANDPYFQITRDDILTLLKTKDDQMIHHMLKHKIFLHINEDVSYKLVKIKGAQVNFNQ